MRYAWMLALVGVGCTSSNPDFGETSTGGGTNGTTGTSASTSTTTVSTSMTPDTSATVDPSTTTTTGPSDESSSSGERSRECCNADDCAPAVTECMCELPNEACCTGPWTEECPSVAIACGGVCDGVEYSCCEPQAMGACTGVQLITGFCFNNPACCLVEWEPQCVAAYDEATEGSCGLESCAEPHESPGCDNGDVMQCVCVDQQLPQCCNEMWHEQCAVAAQSC